MSTYADKVVEELRKRWTEPDGSELSDKRERVVRAQDQMLYHAEQAELLVAIVAADLAEKLGLKLRPRPINLPDGSYERERDRILRDRRKA